MAQYLVTCRCGKQVPVDERWAGQQARCECGQVIDVPTLRQLRALPVVPATTSGAPSPWTFHKGLAAASVVAAVGCAALGGYFFWRQWKLLNELPRFDPQKHNEFVEQQIADMTPLNAWRRWVSHYRPLAEQGIQEYPGSPLMERHIRLHRIYGVAMFGITTLCLLIAIGVLRHGGRRT